MEKEFGVSVAREKLGDLVEKVQYQGDTFIISRRGVPAAAMVPIQVYENWKRQREELFSLIRNMQEEADLSPEDAELLAAEAVAAARRNRK